MSDPWPIHTLVFDLDDTLIAEADYVASGFAATGAWVEKNLRIQGFTGTAMRLFHAGHRGRIFNEVLGELGVEATGEVISRLVAIYRSHKPRLELLPDARDVLTWAKPRFALALISDGPLESQSRKVAALQLDDLIPRIVLTDRWGREFWKPSPQAFREVMAGARVESSGYVYVGDDPRKDFIAPRSLGWRTVRVRRSGGENFRLEARAGCEADFEVGDLHALTQLLVSAEAG